jgi:hypothetical protein
MSDSPLPPQTDYPYAARMHVGAVGDEPSATEPRKVVGGLAERLEDAFDSLSGNNSCASASEPLRFGPAMALALCAFAAIDVMPLVVIEIFENFGGRPSNLLVILTLAPWGGMIVGEFIVFAVLLVWSRGNFILRLVIHWVLAIALYSCWAAGLMVVSSIEDWGTASTREAMRAVLMALPVVCLAVQTPLWCLRIYAGWRLEDCSSETGSPSPSQVSIGDILFGTAIVAVSLAMWRAMFDNPNRFTSGFWIFWAVASPVIALISILTVAPLVRLILGLQNASLAIVGLVVYWLILGLLNLAIVLCFLPGEWRDLTLLFSLLTLTGFATVSIPLWLARSAGYRLRIGNGS